MKTSIVTVSISGDLPEKLAAIAAAGFDGVEIFEQDFIAHDGGPREVGRMVRDHGLEITLFQPFRDFEGLPGPDRARAFARAERKFDLMQELGTDLILICSSVSPGRWAASLAPPRISPNWANAPKRAACASAARRRPGAGLTRIDHIAQTMNHEEMLTWMLFYTAIFDVGKSPVVDVADSGGPVRSQAIGNASASFRITKNGADTHRTFAGRFVADSFGSSVRHIAFACDDILAVADALAAQRSSSSAAARSARRCSSRSSSGAAATTAMAPTMRRSGSRRRNACRGPGGCRGTSGWTPTLRCRELSAPPLDNLLFRFVS